MPYYRIQYMEQDLKEFLEERNNAHSSNSEDANAQREAYASQMRQQQSSIMKSMPKMPTGMKMPTFKMPKI